MRWIAGAIAIVAAAGCGRDEREKREVEPAQAPLFRPEVDAAVVAARPAPEMTVELLLRAGAGAFVDVRRGFLLDLPPQVSTLLCGAELEVGVQQLERVIAHARGLEERAAPERPRCEPRGENVDCSFDDGALDAFEHPESAATFVFRADEARKPVLVAVLLGTATNWVVRMDAELAKGRACEAR